MMSPSEPSTMRIRSKNAGITSLAKIIAKNKNIALATKTPRIRVLSFPNSLFTESRVNSFLNVLANAAIGIVRKFANCIKGITAPSSEGGTYLGTSQSPTNALSASAARQAKKSIKEYHQKSPIF